MQTKMFEIRDRMTFIQAVATLMEPDFGDANFEAVSYLLGRAGYGHGTNLVLLAYAHGGKCEYDTYSWGVSRTMPIAHEYIQKHWHDLETGDVIDVEFILGETKEKKISCRLE